MKATRILQSAVPAILASALLASCYTPIYYVLAHLSRTIRLGDEAVQADKQLENLAADALHASATLNTGSLLTTQLLNTTKAPVRYFLRIGTQYAEVEIAANSLQTVRVQLAN